MKTFRVNPYPTKEEKIQLATLLNTNEKVIQNWFGHKRQRKGHKRLLIGSE